MFQYEASVAGGIPIINGINENLTANKINELYGIVNGTTNYILSKMELENLEFNDVLEEAKEKGYAEADPTSDIEGFDAQYKLAILASLASLLIALLSSVSYISETSAILATVFAINCLDSPCSIAPLLSIY